jgi:hypothetical protein
MVRPAFVLLAFAVGMPAPGAAGGAMGENASSGPRLNTIRDVGDALQACWQPPPIEEAHPGMEVTLVFSFNRDGAVMGEPRFTYSSRDASRRVKTAYQRAVVATLDRCMPLRFTPELGNAIAGHPFAVRFIDSRRIEKREKSI